MRLSDDYPKELEFEHDLFFSPEFFALHRDHFVDAVYLTGWNDREPTHVVHFGGDAEGVFRSPIRGTYGGVASSRPGGLAELDEFYAAVLEYLWGRDARRVEITLSPTVYDPEGVALQINSLERHGFRVLYDDLDYAIRLDPERPFIERVNAGNRKRIKRAAREHLKFEALARTEYRRAYEVIAENRSHRGVPITMTWASLEEMLDAFPDRSAAHGVYRSDELIAASIGFAINRDVFYVFYWGDMPGHSSSSPVTFLADGLYRHAIEQGHSLLDLGISTDRGVPNHGLIRYKTNLGAEVSSKFVLALDRA